jgi:putative Mg2+ transporter-C (MgtC) family protein
MTDEIFIRVLVALALGAAVGAEREVASQPAGLRTHVSVAIGACLFGIVSTLGFEEYVQRRELTNIQVDVTRVASNVVVGIGFLGAGVIFRQGGHVRNLTTAASLWVTAAIGLAAGVGNPAAAAVTTGALVGSLVLLRPLRRFLAEVFTHERCTVRIVVVPGRSTEGVIDALVGASPDVEVRDRRLVRDEGRVVVEAMLVARPRHSCQEATDVLACHDDVATLQVTPIG